MTLVSFGLLIIEKGHIMGNLSDTGQGKRSSKGNKQSGRDSPYAHKKKAHEPRRSEVRPLFLPISRDDTFELEKRLTFLHHGYFQKKESTPVTFRSIGLGSVEELQMAFHEYDNARSRISRATSTQALRALAVLLGIKSTAATAPRNPPLY